MIARQWHTRTGARSEYCARLLRGHALRWPWGQGATPDSGVSDLGARGPLYTPLKGVWADGFRDTKWEVLPRWIV